MQLLWKGQACFHITAQQNKQEHARLVIDPFDPSFVGLRLPLMEADIVLVSHDHSDHNYLKAIKGDPLVISTPGEYEAKDIFIRGISSFHDDSGGKERGFNTMYTIELEGIKICHLGDLGQKELRAEQVEDIGTVDVLLIPVGGIYTIGAKEAANIVSQLEPKIVVPMHYELANLKFKLEKLEPFLRIMGVKNAEPQDKLSLKLKDFTDQESKVVVLAP
ncbi:MAG: MBL fold metallo-hydrolase [Patescibacteria group bacterium]